MKQNSTHQFCDDIIDDENDTNNFKFSEEKGGDEENDIVEVAELEKDFYFCPYESLIVSGENLVLKLLIYKGF